MLSIVVARARNNVIGSGGELPWHLPTDMRHFRTLTSGGTVIMGRKTYESIPDAFRPLPNRRNMVLTTNADYAAPGAEVFPALAAALEACGGEAFMIGGSRVYAQALPLADRVYLTDVQAEPDGDAFFPDLPAEGWRCVEESTPVAENGHEFVFRTYERAAG